MKLRTMLEYHKSPLSARESSLRTVSREIRGMLKEPFGNLSKVICNLKRNFTMSFVDIETQQTARNHKSATQRIPRISGT